MTKLQKAAQTVINRCLDIKSGESVLIIANEPHMDIAHLLFDASQKRSKHAYIVQVTKQAILRGLHNSVAEMMQSMNAVMLVTSPSISHIEARRQACQKGVRIASLPNITAPTFARIADADFNKIKRLSRKLRDILTIGKEITVTAPNGTHLNIPVKNRKGYADTGVLHEPGRFSNLPAGEASIAPEEDKSEGRLVVDSGMGTDNRDSEKLIITIKNGRAVRISGGNAARLLRSRLGKHGPASRVIAEFGIGTNADARLSGYSLEDEKVLGTIHIGLGNNISFGGINDVPIHIDGVVYEATVIIDGKTILQKGQLSLT